MYTVYTSRTLFVSHAAQTTIPPITVYTVYTNRPKPASHGPLGRVDIEHPRPTRYTHRGLTARACLRETLAYPRVLMRTRTRGATFGSSPCDPRAWYDVPMPDLPASHVARRANAPKHDNGTDRQRKRFYRTNEKAWRAQRLRVLIRDSYQCRSCGSWGNEVDHVRNNAHEDVPDEELQTLCRRCHSAKTMRELNSR